MTENIEAIIYELADLEGSQAHDKGSYSKKQKSRDSGRLQITRESTSSYLASPQFISLNGSQQSLQ